MRDNLDNTAGLFGFYIRTKLFVKCFFALNIKFEGNLKIRTFLLNSIVLVLRHFVATKHITPSFVLKMRNMFCAMFLEKKYRDLLEKTYELFIPVRLLR